jgi:glycosyltransferase involved in cell wall biosynthesis
LPQLHESDSTATQPLVSVLIPAFNAEATLGEAVASVLGGSYGNLEVVIINDGSADATAEVAEQFVRADRRVKLLHRPNGGLAAALNSGFQLAKGDYVARLDADDLWHPSKLTRQIELAGQAPDAAFIYTFVRYVDAEGLVLRDAPRQRFPPQALCRSIFESLIGGGSSALMKCAAIEQAGGFQEPFRNWEDLLLQLRISARHPIACVPQYLVGYRVRPGSLSADPRKMLAGWRRARRLILEMFPQVPGYVHAWAHGKRCAELAEAFAWRGKYGTAAALLAEALRYDPSWTMRFLAYRAGRTLTRRLSRPPEPKPGPRFLDSRPDDQVRMSAFDSGREGAALRELERKRAEQLAELDARLFPRPEDVAGSFQPARAGPSNA